jgi:hypothetical protein
MKLEKDDPTDLEELLSWVTAMLLFSALFITGAFSLAWVLSGTLADMAF